MDKLFDELAKSLNVSTDLVQQFVGNYPQLRSQWQLYKVFDLWNDLLSFTAWVILIGLASLWFKYRLTSDSSAEEEASLIHKKWIKYLAVSFILVCLVDYTLLSIQTYLAPDVTFLFETLKHLKK